MRLDRFTIKAQEALQAAQALAEGVGNQELEPEHVLKTLTAQNDGIVPPLLKKLGTNLALLEDRIQNRFNQFPKVSGAAGGVYISPRLKNVLDRQKKRRSNSRTSL